MLIRLSSWKVLKTSIGCGRGTPKKRRLKRSEEETASGVVEVSFVPEGNGARGTKTGQRPKGRSTEPVLTVSSSHQICVIGRRRGGKNLEVVGGIRRKIAAEEQQPLEECTDLVFTSRPGKNGALLTKKWKNGSNDKNKLEFRETGGSGVATLFDPVNRMMYALQNEGKSLCSWNVDECDGPDDVQESGAKGVVGKIELEKKVVAVNLLPVDGNDSLDGKGGVVCTFIDGSIFVAMWVAGVSDVDNDICLRVCYMSEDCRASLSKNGVDDHAQPEDHVHVHTSLQSQTSRKTIDWDIDQVENKNLLGKKRKFARTTLPSNKNVSDSSDGNNLSQADITIFVMTQVSSSGKVYLQTNKIWMSGGTNVKAWKCKQNTIPVTILPTTSNNSKLASLKVCSLDQTSLAVVYKLTGAKKVDQSSWWCTSLSKVTGKHISPPFILSKPSVNYDHKNDVVSSIGALSSDVLAICYHGNVILCDVRRSGAILFSSSHTDIMEFFGIEPSASNSNLSMVTDYNNGSIAIWPTYIESGKIAFSTLVFHSSEEEEDLSYRDARSGRKKRLALSSALASSMNHFATTNSKITSVLPLKFHAVKCGSFCSILSPSSVICNTQTNTQDSTGKEGREYTSSILKQWNNYFKDCELSCAKQASKNSPVLPQQLADDFAKQDNRGGLRNGNKHGIMKVPTVVKPHPFVLAMKKLSFCSASEELMDLVFDRALNFLLRLDQKHSSSASSASQKDYGLERSTVMNLLITLLATKKISICQNSRETVIFQATLLSNNISPVTNTQDNTLHLLDALLLYSDDLSEVGLVQILRYVLCGATPDNFAHHFLSGSSYNTKTNSTNFYAVAHDYLHPLHSSNPDALSDRTDRLVRVASTFWIYRVCTYSDQACNPVLLRTAMRECIHPNRELEVILSSLAHALYRAATFDTTEEDNSCSSRPYERQRLLKRNYLIWMSALLDSHANFFYRLARHSQGAEVLDYVQKVIKSESANDQSIMSLHNAVLEFSNDDHILQNDQKQHSRKATKRKERGMNIPSYSIERLLF